MADGGLNDSAGVGFSQLIVGIVSSSSSLAAFTTKGKKCQQAIQNKLIPFAQEAVNIHLLCLMIFTEGASPVQICKQFN